METKDFSKVPIVWEPSENSDSTIKAFQSHISEKYGVQLNNFWDLNEWTVKNFREFWAELWDIAGLICSETYKTVLEPGVAISDSPKWFPEARLNYAENLLKYRDDNIALFVTGEEREMKTFTFKEMYREACRYGAAFKKLGLKTSDCVACYMSNREEPIFAMLGAVSAGAIWTGALPLLGPQAVINRLKQVNPKFLFTIDRFLHDGEETNLIDNLKEIVNGLPTLEKVVIVPSKPESLLKDISEIRNSCFLEEFLSLGVNSDGSVPELTFEQLPFHHPVFINFTSGTTGDPKGLIHGPCMLLPMTRDFCLHNFSTGRAVWLSMSPVGWATWAIFSTILFHGSAIVLYEGVPFYKHPTSLWDLVDECSISNLFLTPSVLDELEKRGYVPGEHNHLSSLQAIMSGASVVKLQNYDFVYKKVKTDVMFGSAYGSTEFMGASMLLDRSLPVHKGEISTSSFGMNICCYNEKGEAVVGELGELVIANPTPSMPLGLIGDENNKRFKETYFNKFTDVFISGDLAYINPVTKGIVICCRSDDTLKPKGCRFGSSEIYNVVDLFPEVKDSLCVSQYNAVKDERAVLFLKMRNDHLFTEDLVHRIRRAIERELSSRHVPEVILESPDIPHNLNGKKMEILVKKIINRMSYNPENVSNIECLDFFKNVPELQGY